MQFRRKLIFKLYISHWHHTFTSITHMFKITTAVVFHCTVPLCYYLYYLYLHIPWHFYEWDTYGEFCRLFFKAGNYCYSKTALSNWQAFSHCSSATTDFYFRAAMKNEHTTTVEAIILMKDKRVDCKEFLLKAHFGKLNIASIIIVLIHFYFRICE